jgi:hypothetical protein
MEQDLHLLRVATCFLKIHHHHHILLFHFFLNSVPAKQLRKQYSFKLPQLSIPTVHRGHEEGPWKDGLPFDGRDIWQFTVVMNDHMENKWVVQPGSFRNLGQNRQVRCWPWTSDHTLPYQRSGADQDHCRFPTGEIILHLCVGPFGCQGKTHKHDFAEAA